MGGTNPYITETEVRPPTQKYTITFLPMNTTIEVDPAKLPYDHNGHPGSVLDIALGHGIDIDHACGGVCACSTCHVFLREGVSSVNETIEEEEDQLDNAPNVGPLSRLACKLVPDGSCDVVVEIPEWNRNLVQEGH